MPGFPAHNSWSFSPMNGLGRSVVFLVITYRLAKSFWILYVMLMFLYQINMQVPITDLNSPIREFRHFDSSH